MTAVLVLVALLLWLLRVMLMRRRRIRAGLPVSGPWYWPGGKFRWPGRRGPTS